MESVPACGAARRKLCVDRSQPGGSERALRLSRQDAGQHRSPTHFHPVDEHLIVISGVFDMGHGDKLGLGTTRSVVHGREVRPVRHQPAVVSKIAKGLHGWHSVLDRQLRRLQGCAVSQYQYAAPTAALTRLEFRMKRTLNGVLSVTNINRSS